MDGGGVVIEAGSAVFEQRGNEDDAELAGEFAEAVGDRAGEGIREIEEGGVLDGAEIRSQEKLLGDDDVRAARRGLADQGFMVIERFGFGREGAGLEQGEAWHGGSIAGESG